MSDAFRMTEGLNHRHNSSDLSIETSCDTSDPFNMFSGNISPIPVSRKLDFTHIDDEETPQGATTNSASLSPPYRRVRALRLFDDPRSPASLYDKCSTPSHPHSRTRLFPPRLNVPSKILSGSSHHLHPPTDEDSALGSLLEGDSTLPKAQSMPIINPFTPTGQALNKKRALTPTCDASPVQPAKRLRESNIPRYKVEFVELDVLGIGKFGRVTKCINKLDGCVYAIKRSITPVAGSYAERAAATEVYAHAALGTHPHIVRYYSAWAEDNHMVIQSEYCAGGSLHQAIQRGPLAEPELKVLLAHVAKGLAYIHSLQLVHMDLKPENIFIAHAEGTVPQGSDGSDSEDEHQPPRNIYKIGDLGLVTWATGPNVEEGDSRYLPKEVLNDTSHLTKADIFSFGLTLYEAAGGGPMQPNGPQWHAVRDHDLPPRHNLSAEFNQLLNEMTHPDPLKRPTASQLKRHPLSRSVLEGGRGGGDRGREALRRELAATNMRNELLTRKLQEANKCIKSLAPSLQVGQGDSAKFRTRSAKRLQPEPNNFRRPKAKVDAQLTEVLLSVSSPLRERRARRSKKT